VQLMTSLPRACVMVHVHHRIGMCVLYCDARALLAWMARCELQFVARTIHSHDGLDILSAM
jgi:hypothetical protein